MDGFTELNDQILDLTVVVGELKEEVDKIKSKLDKVDVRLHETITSSDINFGDLKNRVLILGDHNDERFKLLVNYCNRLTDELEATERKLEKLTKQVHKCSK